MKNKTAVLLVVALICGLGAAYMTSRYLSAQVKPPQEEKVDVLVAKGPVPQYKPLKEPDKFFAVKQMSKDSASKGYISKLDDIKNKRLKVPLGADKPLTTNDLLDDSGKGMSLSGLVPEGFRAVGIKVTNDETAGGFVLPNTKVDIIASLRRGDNKSTSQTILQDVLVLAVNNTYERDEKTQSVQAHTVTVALTPEDAMKVRLAASVAELSLVLRPDGESKSPALSPIKLSDVIKPVPGTDDEDSATAGGSKKPDGPTVGGLPLPPLDPKKPDGTAEEPKFEKPRAEWIVTIRNGDRVKKQEFFRNKNGDLVSNGDARKDLDKAEPRPEGLTEEKK